MTARELQTQLQSARPPRLIHVLPAEIHAASHYGSGKLFRFLGPHLVNDHIHLHVKIHADRQG